MTEAEIQGFARHYLIPMRLARQVCMAGGSWPKAFDLLVATIKQAAAQAHVSQQPITAGVARKIFDQIEL